MFISMQILIFHPMCNVNIFAYSQSFRVSIYKTSSLLFFFFFFLFFNVAFKAWIFRFSEVNRSTVKEEWRTCHRFSHMDKNDWPYRKYGVNGLLIQTNWVQLHWNTSYTYSMIGKKGLQTQKPMPTVSFSATCEFWRVIEHYLLRCYLPLHRSCLLPGFYISYFMLE